MITGINESKTLTQHFSCECRCRFDGKNVIRWNNGKCWGECKNNHVCEKDYVWNPSKCICENGKYLASIIDDSAIICDEVIMSYEEKIKNIFTNFNEKKVTWKTQNITSLFLITITLLISVSIYCYLIKYQGKDLLIFPNTNNKLNKFCIDSIN